MINEGSSAEGNFFIRKRLLKYHNYADRASGEEPSSPAVLHQTTLRETRLMRVRRLSIQCPIIRIIRRERATHPRTLHQPPLSDRVNETPCAACPNRPVSVDPVSLNCWMLK